MAFQIILFVENQERGEYTRVEDRISETEQEALNHKKILEAMFAVLEIAVADVEVHVEEV